MMKTFIVLFQHNINRYLFFIFKNCYTIMTFFILSNFFVLFERDKKFVFNIIQSALQETHKKSSALGKNNSIIVKNGSGATLKNGKEESSEDKFSDEVLHG